METALTVGGAVDVLGLLQPRRHLAGHPGVRGGGGASHLWMVRRVGVESGLEEQICVSKSTLKRRKKEKLLIFLRFSLRKH